MSDISRFQALIKKTEILSSTLIGEGMHSNPLEVDLLKSYLREMYEILLEAEKGSGNVKSAPVKKAAPAPAPPVKEEKIEKVKVEEPIIHETPKVDPPKEVIEFSSSEPVKKVPKEEPTNIKEEVKIETPVSVPEPEPEINEVAEDKTKEIAEKYVDENEVTLNERFGKEVPTVADRATNHIEKDLNKMIDLNSKFQFIAKLFDNDQQVYSETINKLNGMDSFGKAQSYLLEEISDKYNWVDEDKISNNFFNLVKKKFEG